MITPFGEVYNGYSTLSTQYKLGFDVINKMIQEYMNSDYKKSDAARNMPLSKPLNAKSLGEIKSAIDDALSTPMVDESLLKKPGILGRLSKPF